VPDEFPAAPGSLRHLVWLYGGAEHQARHAALFAIEHEIAASIGPALDHAVAHARLGWWEEECARLAATLPRHPRAVELLRESRRAGLPAPDLGPLVAAARWDLARATPETRHEHRQRCAEWARGLFRHLGPAEAADWLLRVGTLIEELALLDALREDARAGRLRVPLEDFAPRGLTVAALRAEPTPPALSDYLRTRHREARVALRRELAALDPSARPGLRAALVWGTLAAIRSERAERALSSRPGAGRFDRWFDPWRDNGSAWTAARRALTGRAP
jgi:hypothetical protein